MSQAYIDHDTFFIYHSKRVWQLIVQGYGICHIFFSSISRHTLHSVLLYCFSNPRTILIQRFALVTGRKEFCIVRVRYICVVGFWYHILFSGKFLIWPNSSPTRSTNPDNYIWWIYMPEESIECLGDGHVSISTYKIGRITEHWKFSAHINRQWAAHSSQYFHHVARVRHLLEDFSVEDRFSLDGCLRAPHFRHELLVRIRDWGSNLGPVVPGWNNMEARSSTEITLTERQKLPESTNNGNLNTITHFFTREFWFDSHVSDPCNGVSKIFWYFLTSLHHHSHRSWAEYSVHE